MPDVFDGDVHARLRAWLEAGAIDSADDETIAAAGLIMRARAEAERIDVLTVNCGDGWKVVVLRPGARP